MSQYFIASEEVIAEIVFAVVFTYLTPFQKDGKLQDAAVGFGEAASLDNFAMLVTRPGTSENSAVEYFGWKRRLTTLTSFVLRSMQHGGASGYVALMGPKVKPGSPHKLHG